MNWLRPCCSTPRRRRPAPTGNGTATTSRRPPARGGAMLGADQDEAGRGQRLDVPQCSSTDDGHVKDRLVVMVRDPYWLHAYWELSRKSVERAKVALGQYWHGARPVLRLCEVLRDGTTTLQPPARSRRGDSWRREQLVYRRPQSARKAINSTSAISRRRGSSICLARSNVVSTPAAAAGDAFDQNWADVAKDFDRIFALSGGYSEPEANGD